MFIDTHAHLYDEQYNSDRDQMMQNARSNGIEKIYLPNCDSSTIEAMLATELAYPDVCHAMMGVHPTYIKENYQDELRIAQSWLEKRDFCAVGEIGLDYYWDKTFAKEQQVAFRTQIEWSLQYKLPIVIHTREATKDTLDIVRDYVSQGVYGVFHCFSGSLETAKQMIDMGFYLGIGGVLTYPKAGLQEVVKQIDLEHFVLETDAPYLTPVPFRGKRNESAYIKIIAEKLAELKEVPIGSVEEITTKNAMHLFRKQAE